MKFEYIHVCMCAETHKHAAALHTYWHYSYKVGHHVDSQVDINIVEKHTVTIFRAKDGDYSEMLVSTYKST
jgi:hypothetical protein